MDSQSKHINLSWVSGFLAEIVKRETALPLPTITDHI